MDISNAFEYEDALKLMKEQEKQEDIKNNPTKEEVKVDFEDRINGRDKIRYIHDYDYVPYEYVKHSVEGEDDNLYLGFELEVDGGGKRDSVAKKVIDMLGEECCFCMHDGSLESGFEIVTNPSTLGFYKTQPLEQLLKMLKGEGYKETFRAGLHIHINRDFFGENVTEEDFNIIKLIYLVEKHWNYTKVVARRENRGYAKRIEGVDSLIRLYSTSREIGKMACVNLMHKDSIEFRIFASTLSYMNLFASLEYVRNLAYICKATSIEDIEKISFKDIVEYKPTEYLETYLAHRKVQF